MKKRDLTITAIVCGLSGIATTIGALVLKEPATPMRMTFSSTSCSTPPIIEDSGDGDSGDSDSAAGGDAAASCCTGGIGSIPLQCNCIQDMEFNANGSEFDGGAGTPQLFRIGDWSMEGSPVQGNPSNPHGTCYAVGQDPVIPCDDGGSCVAMIAYPGDAAAYCPTLYDASAYLITLGMSQPDQTILSGYIQSNFHVSPPYTIETRTQEPPVEAGHWPIAMIVYEAEMPGQNCEKPDWVAAYYAPPPSCFIDGWGTAPDGAVVPYYEVDTAENYYDNGYLIGKAGFGTHVPPSCGTGVYHFVDADVTEWHVYTESVTAGGAVTYWIDGIEQFSSNMITCDGGAPFPTASLTGYLSWGIITGGASGSYDGSAWPATELTDYVRITSP